ncbi:hypothetical protein [Chondrinema litorale]|uniref:hypothetical protein n=1 Tax=Chondrinema litorale TaxID=2994555 RepID=UPI002542B7C8|nr:hypothetical protein [Chondrinema litorale]UZR94345.1 hypothetical protein OQ292_00755 [Chondrinema litorale]
MLQVLQRPLSEIEKESIYLELERVEKKKRFHFIFTIASSVLLVVSGFAIFFLLGTEDQLKLVMIAIALIIFYGFSVIWGYFNNKKFFDSTIDEYMQALKNNSAKVYKCYFDDYAAFENKSLDDPAFIFQVEDDLLLFVSGRDFYETDEFPNSDFEISRVAGVDGKIVFNHIECKGIKISPKVVLSDYLKKELRELKKYPESFKTFQGNLSNLNLQLFN